MAWRTIETAFQRRWLSTASHSGLLLGYLNGLPLSLSLGDFLQSAECSMIWPLIVDDDF